MLITLIVLFLVLVLLDFERWAASRRKQSKQIPPKLAEYQEKAIERYS